MKSKSLPLFWVKLLSLKLINPYAVMFKFISSGKLAAIMKNIIITIAFVKREPRDCCLDDFCVSYLFLNRATFETTPIEIIVPT